MGKRNYRILIVDDDKDVLTTLKLVLGHYFTHLETERFIANLPNRLATEKYDLVLLDMNFRKGMDSGQEGLYWLQQIKQHDPATAIVLITAYGDIELAVEAMKQGADDFLLKPWTNEKLLGIVEKALPKKVKPETEKHPEIALVFGDSPTMTAVMKTVQKVAPTAANVLLLGENGTGKSSIASAIHQLSLRQQAPFVAADLGTLNENLFESALFGHMKGAFTGAQIERQGFFQQANGGTLFLDEIANIPMELQAKLLSVLQNRTLNKLGSTQEEAIDIRLIAATNQDIQALVKQKAFRQDLLFRLNTITITLPPLRERPEDLPRLYEYFVQQFALKYNKSIKTQTGTLKKLSRYQWPGNIRELQNCIERAVIMCEEETIGPEDFMLSERLNDAALFQSYNLEAIEKMLILKAIDQHHGNLTQAAKELGLTRPSLYRRMEKYDL
ncbi:MAG: sigma-54 dependent transcriptional regulator [Saprospiraceae bacterium]